MRYQASPLDRIVAVMLAIRALYAMAYIVLVLMALAGVLNLQTLSPELARFFALQPEPLFFLWVIYPFGYLFAANFLWSGRPTRALLTYVCAFAFDVILWTLVVTLHMDDQVLPFWGRVMDFTITSFDLAAIGYLVFVVLVIRKPVARFLTSTGQR